MGQPYFGIAYRVYTKKKAHYNLRANTPSSCCCFILYWLERKENSRNVRKENLFTRSQLYTHAAFVFLYLFPHEPFKTSALESHRSWTEAPIVVSVFSLLFGRIFRRHTKNVTILNVPCMVNAVFFRSLQT